MSALAMSAEATRPKQVGHDDHDLDPPDPDPHDITVLVRDPAWRAAVPEAEACCRAAALATIAAAARGSGRTAPAAACALAIMLADDVFLRQLNLRYRGRDAPTNVLAFPSGDGDRPAPAETEAARALGDVAIARETMLREAAAQGKSPDDHLRHLVVHGVLHLFGYDHLTAGDAAEMEAIEVAVLAGLGVTDPYAEPPRTGES